MEFNDQFGKIDKKLINFPLKFIQPTATFVFIGIVVSKRPNGF